MDKLSLLLRGLRIDWEEIDSDSYLRQIPALAGLRELEFEDGVTFFVGENGSGKSTLLEAIAICYGFNPEGGTKNYRFSTYDSHSELCRAMTLIKGAGKPGWGYFLRAESFYNVASNIDQLDREPGFGPPLIDSYGGLSLHRQSHGESFLALAENRFGGRGLYILDEPEAALSPMRLLRLMARMRELVNDQSQFIISTHSPILMAFPDAEVYEITADGMERVGFRDTAHWQITRGFLENPEKMMKYLFDEEDG